MLRALLERLRDRSEPPPLDETMSHGADEFQARLDDARERLRKEIPPPPDDDQSA